MTNHVSPLRCQVDGCANEVTCIVHDGQESPFATCGQHNDHDCDCGQCVNARDASSLASALLAALLAKEIDVVDLCDSLAQTKRELFEAKLRIKMLEESLVLAQSEPRQTSSPVYVSPEKRCYCECHEYPGTYPTNEARPCSHCGHVHTHGEIVAGYRSGWAPR